MAIKKDIEASNYSITIISSSCWLSESDNELKIEVIRSEHKTTLLVLLLFVPLMSLFSLFFFYINFSIVGIVYVITDILITVFLFFVYLRHKRLIIEWVIDNSLRRITKTRKVPKPVQLKSIDFSEITSVILSQTQIIEFSKTFLLFHLKHKRKYKICYGNLKQCEKLGDLISKFMKKPFLKRDYFKSAIIFTNLTFGFFIFLSYFILDPFLRYNVMVPITFMLFFLDIYVVILYIKEVKKYRTQLRVMENV